MRVVFRVDASTWIGSGHVMRCLTLAAELMARDYCCTFICCYCPAALQKKIIDVGCSLYLLPIRLDVKSDLLLLKNDSRFLHEAWLGASQQVDAELCCAYLIAHPADYIVVDHYGIDALWQKIVSAHAAKIVVIDDLADRSHYCDLLVDQNFGRLPENYQGLIISPSANKEPLVLAGTDYCLLRAQFYESRQQLASNRFLQQFPRRILLSFGGVDALNMTLRTLQCLYGSLELKNSFNIDCVLLLGSQYIFDVQLDAFMKEHNLVLEIHRNIDDVAPLLQSCDMAIGACGSSVWEYCCVGLPALLVATADNQQNLIERLLNYSIIDALSLDDYEHQLIKKISHPQFIEQLNQLSYNASQLVDGLGVSRVVDAMALMSA